MLLRGFLIYMRQAGFDAHPALAITNVGTGCPEVFNYRLSQTQYFLECTYDIMVREWSVFTCALHLDDLTVNKAACIFLLSINADKTRVFFYRAKDHFLRDCPFRP